MIQSDLWQKLKSFELDDPDAEFSFSDRLARENGWSHEFAIRAIEEYKKFIFLICQSDQLLTPSDEVDQVWHLHLLYTQSYWKEMCGEILKRDIHHGPTKGGKQEQQKYREAYQRTLELYQQEFDVAAPQDIWPSADQRFRAINFRRVNVDRNWIIQKFWNHQPEK